MSGLCSMLAGESGGRPASDVAWSACVWLGEAGKSFGVPFAASTGGVAVCWASSSGCSPPTELLDSIDFCSPYIRGTPNNYTCSVLQGQTRKRGNFGVLV